MTPATLFRCAMRHFTLARIGINREDNAYAASAAIRDFNRRVTDRRLVAAQVFHSHNDNRS